MSIVAFIFFLLGCALSIVFAIKAFFTWFYYTMESGQGKGLEEANPTNESMKSFLGTMITCFGANVCFYLSSIL